MLIIIYTGIWTGHLFSVHINVATTHHQQVEEKHRKKSYCAAVLWKKADVLQMHYRSTLWQAFCTTNLVVVVTSSQVMQKHLHMSELVRYLVATPSVWRHHCMNSCERWRISLAVHRIDKHSSSSDTYGMRLRLGTRLQLGKAVTTALPTP